MASRRLEDGRNVGFTLLPEQLDTIKMWAEAEDRSMSAVVRRLIDAEAERRAASPVEVEGKS